MAVINLNGCDYHYECQGSGSETMLFSHGLLWSGKIFQPQVNYFKQRYQIITYDHRGQGQSQVTDQGYDMDSLTDDAIQLIEQLDLGKVHFVGLSMGGFVGLRLAARRPDLIRSLILMGTSAQPEAPSFKYKVLSALVKLFGTKVVASSVMKIFFAEKFLKDKNRRDQYHLWKNEIEANPRTILKAVQGVLSRQGVEAELGNISCPTLIMVGTKDITTTPDKAEFIHQHITQSILKYIPDAGHTPGIEEAQQCNQLMEEFLNHLKS